MKSQRRQVHREWIPAVRSICILLLTSVLSRFLSYVDLQGTTYSAPSMATGYGSMIALPLMRKAQEDAPNGQLSESEAEELLKTCMKVLFYRDARSLNKVSNGHMGDAEGKR